MKTNASKLRWILFCIVISCISMQSCASKQKAAKPYGTSETRKELTATVEAINYEAREVTVKGPKGNKVTLKVGEDAYNFKNIEVGDLVEITYEMSIAVTLQEASAGPSMIGKTDILRSPEGRKPEGVIYNVVDLRAVVESIDYTNRTVELRGPSGDSVFLSVDNSVKNFENVKKGDEVLATYTEAIAYSVKKAEKK